MSLVPNQIIKIIPRNSNIKYYKELGYTFEKGEECFGHFYNGGDY